MATTGAYRIEVIGLNHVLPAGGRHRLGNPGLRYCRHHHPVGIRVATRQYTRHAARISPVRRGAEVAMAVAMLMVTGTVLISGWYAVTGAAVMVGMVSR
jgi:hypothetical protein